MVRRFGIFFVVVVQIFLESINILPCLMQRFIQVILHLKTEQNHSIERRYINCTHLSEII